jgi:hypothetical protein
MHRYITDTGEMTGGTILDQPPAQQLETILPFIAALLGGPTVGGRSVLRSGGAMNPDTLKAIVQQYFPGSRTGLARVKAAATDPRTGLSTFQYQDRPVDSIEELFRLVDQFRK